MFHISTIDFFDFFWLENLRFQTHIPLGISIDLENDCGLLYIYGISYALNSKNKNKKTLMTITLNVSL